MPEKMDNRIYEQEQTTEKQEKLKKYNLKRTEKKTWKELSSKITQIDNKLSKLAWNQDGKDFFIKNMNDYVQSKFWVKFEKASVWWKKELVLVIPKDKQASPDPIKWLEKLAKNLTISDKEIFIDEDWDKKLNENEMWIKIDTGWELETNAIYVDKNELRNHNVNFWKIKEWQWKILDSKYTHGWKIIFENWKSYYEVGGTTDKNWHYDYLSAVSKLFTAISTEYLWWMDLKTINEKIKNLCYNKKTWEFKVFNNWKPDKWYEKIWDTNSPKWKQIVQPHSKIDLSSLSKALAVWKVGKQPVKIEKKELKNNIDWWRFYESADGETRDIPDKWNINYEWYSQSFKWLSWSQISICAKNDYDFWNKDKWKLWKNTFSGKIKVNLWTDKDWKVKEWFLVIWETSDKDILNNIKWKNNIKDLRSTFKGSNTEAWFTVVEKWHTTMTEVWDPKVQTITETSDTVEKWQDKNHPIVLSWTKYEFSGEIKGDITFSLEKGKDSKKNNNKFSIDTKKSNLKSIQSKKKFEEAFWWDKAYLLVENHLVELSWNDKDKKIISKDLWEKKTGTTFDNWSVTIENWLFSDMKFDKKTWEVEFPEVSGWWKINGKLKKINDKDKDKNEWIQKWDILFKLWEEYKIWWKEININLWNNHKLKPNEIFEKTINWLLLLANEEKISKSKGNNFWVDKDIINNKNDQEIFINIKTENSIKLGNLWNLMTKDKKENSDTYIIDAIKKEFEKKDTTKQVGTPKKI